MAQSHCLARWRVCPVRALCSRERRFKEADTSAAILAELKTLGIPDSDIRVMAGTGIVADIRGTAAPIGSAAGSAGAAPAEGAPDGAVVIALRADMDALPVRERRATPR